MMKQGGSSIVEVTVMIMILSISIVSIYSTINSGGRFTRITDEKLVATNLARAGLESINALRDTFLLRSYSARDCFFTLDASNLDTTKCYRSGTRYHLSDDATLEESTNNTPTPVCINADGWFSQTWIRDGVDCTSAPKCNAGQKQSCQTPFSRSIEFMSCIGYPGMHDCVRAKTTVVWGTINPQSIILEQTFMKNT